jgi:hypothetical protein
MALNMQNFIDSENRQPENNTRYNNNMKENATRLYSEKKEIYNNQVKAFIIPISTYRNKNMHKTRTRCKKNRECLVQLYEAIIPI